MTDNRFFYNDLLEELIQHSKTAEKEVLLVAPFIKYRIFRLLIDELDPSIYLTVFTRWRLDEILSGVSDIEIWELIRGREKSVLNLSPNLHAKYYRFDDSIFLGSANLTEKALVKSPASNLEILQKASLSDPYRHFEKCLESNKVFVDEQLFEQVKQIVDLHDKETIPDSVNELGIDYTIDDITEQRFPNREQWIPKSRNPDNLFVYYSGNIELLTDVQKQNAKDDLAYFPIPIGLNKDEFNRFISFYILQMPIILKIDAFLTQSRRFGEMSSFLENNFDLKKRGLDSKRVWQNIIRWLNIFLNDKYYVENARYSEIILKR